MIETLTTVSTAECLEIHDDFGIVAKISLAPSAKKQCDVANLICAAPDLLVALDKLWKHTPKIDNGRCMRPSSTTGRDL